MNHYDEVDYAEIADQRRQMEEEAEHEEANANHSRQDYIERLEGVVKALWRARLVAEAGSHPGLETLTSLSAQAKEMILDIERPTKAGV